MADLLVSFCGPTPSRAVFARVTFETAEIRWLPVPALPADAVGMGLCPSGGGFRALWMREPGISSASGLIELGADLAPRAAHPLALVEQAHSIARYRDGALVNSTGNDAVVRLTWSGDGPPREEVLWAAGDRDHRVHVNSLLVSGDRVFVTMFGPKVDGSWYDTRGGSVREITRDVEVVGGLSHPHSLFLLGDRLCVLESFTGRVLDVTAGTPTEVTRVEGYARGAVAHRDHLYVATSFIRLRSRHTGRARRESKLRSRCAIVRVDLRTGAQEICDLCQHGREIYDLALLPAQAG